MSNQFTDTNTRALDLRSSEVSAPRPLRRWSVADLIARAHGMRQATA